MMFARFGIFGTSLKRFRLSNSGWVCGAIFIACALMGTTDGLGQSDQLDRARDYIDRTSELLEQAESTVSESDSERARRLLKEAFTLHNRSQTLLDRNQATSAVKMSHQARVAAGEAAKWAREALGYERRALMRLERFRDAHDQIRDRALEQGNERAHRFLREAEKQGLRAWEQYNQSNFAMALSLLEPADALLNRAARLLFEAGSQERLVRELDRTAALIERTEERLDNRSDQTSRELLASARSALSRAREHLNDNQPALAMHQSRLARKFVEQAAGLASDGLSVETVQAQIERWDQRNPAIADAVQASGSDHARSVYEQALRHRSQAAELLGKEELEAALRHIKVALDLLNEAGELTR